jgi:aspartyl-tRNA(Asn)/glutamyl-tRNA(Gln) amidotransferase subunit B
MQQAMDYEIRWQIEQLEDGKSIEQATVLFNPDTGETRAMRTKEDSADYRYFPDPDLPPLMIAPEWIERVRSDMPKLPSEMVQHFVADYDLSEYDAAQLTQSHAMAEYFENAVKMAGKKSDERALAKLAANWILGDLSAQLNSRGLDISQSPLGPEQLAAHVQFVFLKKIANPKALFKAIVEDESGAIRNFDKAVEQFERLIREKDLAPMADDGALEKIIDEVIAANTDNVAQFKAGKDKAFNALVGQVMKASKGKANPQQVNDLLHQKLK